MNMPFKTSMENFKTWNSGVRSKDQEISTYELTTVLSLVALVCHKHSKKIQFDFRSLKIKAG